MKRRNFLKGAGIILAAPAIVKAEFLMPVQEVKMLSIGTHLSGNPSEIVMLNRWVARPCICPEGNRYVRNTFDESHVQRRYMDAYIRQGWQYAGVSPYSFQVAPVP